MRYGGVGARYRNVDVIADGASLEGTGVELVNTESGRIIGGVRFETGGHVLVNDEGGVIRVANGANEFTTAAIIGSSGADTVRNAGAIIGLVNLGAGADSFHSSGPQAVAGKVDLGSGDDLLLDEGGARQSPQAEGGEGRDRFSIAHNGQNVFYGSGVTGFEDLSILGGGQFVGFSGYGTITLGVPTIFGASLIGSANPLADLFLAGHSVRLHTSSIGSVTGGDTTDRLELNTGAEIVGAVDLGGGDDMLSLWNSFPADADAALPLAGVSGGAGADTLSIQLPAGRARGYDFSKVTGFETLSVNYSSQAAASVQIANAAGLSSIDLGSFVSLSLQKSSLAGANLNGSFGGAISLDAASRIGRYGFPPDGPFDQNIDLQQADDRLSVAFTNDGAVDGEMRFHVGDDLYDGRAGSVGGTVYGNAGNDTLLGGDGAERLEGGFGADRLGGGAGADTLLGGSGGDLLDGGAGADRMDGGPGDDRFTVDDVGDQIAETASGGFDTLTVTAANYLLNAGASVELLRAEAGVAAINIGGNEQSQRLEGNAGANILSSGGGGGVDTMAGGLGDDVYRVFATGDVIEDTGGFDTVYASGTSYFLFSTAAVEYLSASEQAGTTPIYLVGNGAAQVIAGNWGDNILNGRGGNDERLPDTLIGLFGNDQYGVFSQGDVVREAAGQGVDVVYANASYQLRSGAEVEGLSAVDQRAADAGSAYTLRGNEVAQTVAGNNAANVLDGRGGADTLVGLGGADVFAFTSALGAGNVDTIRDFAADDRIGLGLDVFAAVAEGGVQANELALGTAAQDGDDRLVYDQATGRLFYDADGSGVSAAVLFAQLAPGTALSAASFTVVQPTGDLPAM